MKKLYVAASNDEYQLPVFIEDTLDVLASKINCKKSTVKSCISRQKHGDYHVVANGYVLYSIPA